MGMIGAEINEVVKGLVELTLDSRDTRGLLVTNLVVLKHG